MSKSDFSWDGEPCLELMMGDEYHLFYRRNRRWDSLSVVIITC